MWLSCTTVDTKLDVIMCHDLNDSKFLHKLDASMCITWKFYALNFLASPVQFYAVKGVFLYFFRLRNPQIF